MKLIDDVRNAPKFWSIRLSVLAAALSSMEATMPLFRGTLPDGTFAVLSMVVAMAAVVARTVKQERLK